MGRFKGIIAVDVDGTLTARLDGLEEEVANYFNQLIKKGWLVIFLTGRTFSFAKPIISTIQGKYFLGVQNGAALYEMPSVKPIKTQYIAMKEIMEVEHLLLQKGVGLLIESGKESEDLCYYKPKDYSEEDLKYLNFRMEISPEKWVAVENFSELPLTKIAVGKFFSTEKKALEVAEVIVKNSVLSVTVIRDPFRLGFHLAHINSPFASKGQILEEFINLQGEKLPVIAAGDDYNDVEMLEKSTIKIVMENAPEKLHALADILAPPASRGGIVQGIEEAIARLGEGSYGRDNSN